MSGVYDDEEKPINPIGPSDSSNPSEPAPPTAENILGQERNAATGGSGKGDNLSNTPTSGGLGSAEKAAGEDDKVGKGYTGDTPKANVPTPGTMPTSTAGFAAKTIKVLWSTPTRKGSTVGASVMGIAGIFTIVTLMVAPMKVMHITQNLQDQFFGVGEQAMSDMTEHLVVSYLIKQVMPGMLDGVCSTTRVNRTCAAPVEGVGPIKQLYRAWRDVGFENKLANKYGIELMRMGSGRDATFYIRTPQIGEDARLGTLDNIIHYDGDIFAEVNTADRNAIRRALNSSIAEQTGWKQLYYRNTIGKYVERKYGIRRCTFACDTRDRTSDWWDMNVNDRKKAGKGKFVNFITNQMDESSSIILECAFNGFDCANYQDPDIRGDRSTRYEADLLERLHALNMQSVDVEKLLEKSEAIKQKGLTGYVLEEVSAKIGLKISAKTIPIFGWVDLAINLYDGAVNALPALKYLNYKNVTGVMATTFAASRVLADEQKLGLADMAEIGAATEQYCANGFCAEQAPLYNKYISSNEGSTLANIFNPSAYAESSTSILTEACEEEPAPGELICPNESVKTDPDSLIYKNIAMVSDGVKSTSMPGLDKITSVYMQVENAITGFISGIGMAVFKALGLDAALKAITDIVKLDTLMTAFSNWFFSKVVVQALKLTANGINWFNVTAGGADVIANTANQDTLGAATLPDEEVQAIRSRYLNEQKELFRQQSLYARLFDKTNTRSAISQVALSIPTNATYSMQSFASSIISNPFAPVGNIFSSIFSSGRADAGTFADPFGIKQSGYEPDDPVFSEDPDTYRTKNNCDDPNQQQQWAQEYSEVDEDTQQVILTKSNGCKLQMAAIESAGGFSDPSLLPEESVNNTGQNSTETAVVTDGFAWPVDLSKADASNFYEGGGVDWNCNTKSTKCHRGSAALDIAHKDGNEASTGKAVYAVTTGKMYNAHTYNGKAGCYSFHIKDADGWDYYYTHVQNAIITSRGQEQSVTVGQKIAEIGTKDCGDTAAHLHIDRGTKGFTGGETDRRDLGFVDLMVKIHNNLPQ